MLDMAIQMAHRLRRWAPKLMGRIILMSLSLLLLSDSLVGQQQSAFIAQADSLFEFGRKNYQKSILAIPSFEKAAKLYFSSPAHKDQWLESVVNLAYHLQRQGDYEALTQHADSCLRHLPKENVNSGNAVMLGHLYRYLVYALEQTANYRRLISVTDEAIGALRQPHIAPSLVEHTIYGRLYDFRARAAHYIGDDLLALNLADTVMQYYRQQADLAEGGRRKQHHLAVLKIFRTKQSSLANLGKIGRAHV